jgi:hypothetical protein
MTGRFFTISGSLNPLKSQIRSIPAPGKNVMGME